MERKGRSTKAAELAQQRAQAEGESAAQAQRAALEAQRRALSEADRVLAAERARPEASAATAGSSPGVLGMTAGRPGPGSPALEVLGSSSTGVLFAPLTSGRTTLCCT